MSPQVDYIAKALFYNLNILPELLIMGSIILSIVLANHAVLAMAIGAIATTSMTGAINGLLARLIPDSAKHTPSTDSCDAGVMKSPWYNLLFGTYRLWDVRSPSVYLASIAFFVGYGLGLQTLYKEEIDAHVVSRPALIATAVTSILILLTTIVYRIFSGCESLMGAMGGTAIGFILGYLICVTVGYVTDRRATNIWGIPLLRDRINNGSAVYICPDP
jgi:hypothetical protein